jgi:hypothetical protein
MELARIRLEWRGGVYEEFANFDEARQKVLAVFPSAVPLPWGTTADGNYRHLSFLEQAGQKAEPVARILIPLAD